MSEASLEVDVAAGADATIGESPVWSARHERLLWIDITGTQLHVHDPAEGTSEVVTTPSSIGFLAEDPSGDLVLGLEDGLARLGADGKIERFAGAPHANPAFRFNDGKFDAHGRLWTGLMSREGKKLSGILYRFDPDGTWNVADTGFDLPNGLEWSRDGRTFYFTDSHKGEIYAYDFDAASGAIENRRLFFSMDPAEGKPDGLTRDAEGYLLSVLFDGSAIARLAPDGPLERLVPLPVPRPTSCAFGGDGRTLFVTTARIGLSDAQLEDASLSGSLLQLDYDDAVR
ncbi:SMP-30/gluconolactonase/LRE family protein [Salipiger mucosus]|uniref:SMP-30/gluconolactonase/LRE family protein n=1 Tax=Salipiger mucosus TaxID=263378 RepID=UPI00035F6220|nr:SMP-30/gluconolactonase/LRE family protein [Salipiger mucosus]